MTDQNPTQTMRRAHKSIKFSIYDDIPIDTAVDLYKKAHAAALAGQSCLQQKFEVGGQHYIVYCQGPTYDVTVIVSRA